MAAQLVIEDSEGNVIAHGGSLAVGSFHVGLTRTVGLTLRNTGDATLAFAGLSLDAGLENLSGEPLSLAPGDFAQLDLRVTGTPIGAFSRTFTAASDDPTHPLYDVEITGTVRDAAVRHDLAGSDSSRHTLYGGT